MPKSSFSKSFCDGELCWDVASPAGEPLLLDAAVFFIVPLELRLLAGARGEIALTSIDAALVGAALGLLTDGALLLLLLLLVEPLLLDAALLFTVPLKLRLLAGARDEIALTRLGALVGTFTSDAGNTSDNADTLPSTSSTFSSSDRTGVPVMLLLVDA